MTGKMELEKDQGALGKHVRLSLKLDSDKRLNFINKRLFGEIGVCDDKEEFIKNKGLGPDALDITEDQFIDLMEGKKGYLKSSLMNQKNLAGLGNIYVDEILFQAKMHPETKLEKLGKKELKSLYGKMRKVLKKAVDVTPNFEKIPDTWLFHHREDGAKCPGCQGNIKKIKAAGRSTYYCPSRQVKNREKK